MIVIAMKKLVLHPVRPERICWGCDKLCPAEDLRCGNGTVRTMHPCELFGDDWLEWSLGAHGAEHLACHADHRHGPGDECHEHEAARDDK